MGADFRGDPASAMLEVLDPEQNGTFRDHYLDVPLDLSNVMFIATANTLDTIPGPLRDRMEVIEIAGYTEEEKLQIAKRYLVPRQVERNGLKRKQISIHDRALRAVIRDYTREAGVRNLEREIGSMCRKVARQVAEGPSRGASASTRPARGSCSAASGSSARPSAAPARPAWRPVWRGRRWAATCSSSKSARCRAPAS
jgi:ATP-dependent Lon protease